MPTDPASSTASAPFRASMWLSYLSDVGLGMLLQAQWDGGMPFHRTNEIPGAVSDPLALLPEGAQLQLDQLDESDRTVVATLPGLLIRLEVEKRVTRIDVVGADLAAVETTMTLLREAVTAAVVIPDGEVRMGFWSFQDGAGDQSSRRIAAPTWSESEMNYSAGTRESLSRLMSSAHMSERAGRLILWHGLPGTGKTTAVRALSREWSSWCTPHYVMDPERLFAEPQYLLQVAGTHEDEDEDKWRLVVAEDCDEYLRADARSRAGASLGRLLNLSDGILGHGLKVLILLTTNEDIGELHPAITRPGRCLSQVEFTPLSQAEARSWLGGDLAPERPLTLAELYALRDDRADRLKPRAAELGGYL